MHLSAVSEKEKVHPKIKVLHRLLTPVPFQNNISIAYYSFTAFFLSLLDSVGSL